jgi:hypothetical protein
MKTYVALILILSVPSASFAQSYEKNALPCTAELCIGDGLAELGKIKWDHAKAALSLSGKPDYVGSRSLSPFEILPVKQIYRGDVTAAAPYLAYEAFDGKALPLLAGVTAACGRKELRGTFTTDGGNPTIVEIALVSDKLHGTAQRWAVTSISRDFPAVKSGAQKADVRKQLDERYGRFNVSRGIQRGVDATYAIHEDTFMGRRYGFTLWLNEGPDDYERYLQNPACGGKEKVSID